MTRDNTYRALTDLFNRVSQGVGRLAAQPYSTMYMVKEIDTTLMRVHISISGQCKRLYKIGHKRDPRRHLQDAV